MKVAESFWTGILQKLLLKFRKITFLESLPMKSLEAGSLDLINFEKVKRDLVVQHVSVTGILVELNQMHAWN